MKLRIFTQLDDEGWGGWGGVRAKTVGLGSLPNLTMGGGGVRGGGTAETVRVGLFPNFDDVG